MQKELHHKTKSPSSFPIRNICPSYESGAGGEAARKGTILHKIFENLIQGLPLELSQKDQAELFEGGEIKPADFELIEPEDLNGVIWAKAALLEIIQNYEFGVKDLESLFKEGRAFAERRLPIIGEDFGELTFGTIDFQFENVVVDLKTGRVRNYREQMAAYALAVMQENPNFEDVKIVELYSNQKTFVSYEMTLEEAEKIVFGISARIDNKENEPRVQSDYCAWCSQKTTCPAIVAKVSRIQEERQEFPKEFTFSSKEATGKAIATLQAWQAEPNNEKLREELVEMAANLEFLFKAAKAAEVFLGGVKEQIAQALKAGVPIAGLTLTSKAGKTSIKDVQKAFEISPLDSETFLQIAEVPLTKLSAKLSPEQVLEMYEQEGQELPNHLRGKTKPLTKANVQKAVAHLFKEIGIAEAAPSSSSVGFDKKKSSIDQGGKK